MEPPEVAEGLRGLLHRIGPTLTEAERQVLLEAATMTTNHDVLIKAIGAFQQREARVRRVLTHLDDIPFVTLIREGVVRELREALEG
jgi:hypothetical protein